MKHYLCIFFVLQLLLTLSGCHEYDDSSAPVQPVLFYYCTQSDSTTEAGNIISAEHRETLGHTEDYSYLITLYLNGPLSYHFASPFPNGVTLQEFTIENGNAYVTLSDQITLLSDFRATLAYACLALTIDGIVDVETVTISAKNNLINGNPHIVIRPDSIAFPDGSIS